MTNEVFRFVLARPPKAVAVTEPPVIAVDLDPGDTTVPIPTTVEEARAQLESGNHAKSLTQVSEALAAFDRQLTGGSADVEIAEGVFGEPLQEIVGSEPFRTARRRLARTMIAMSAVGGHRGFEHVPRGLRLLEYLCALAGAQPNAAAILDAPIQLPDRYRPIKPHTQVAPPDPPPRRDESAIRREQGRSLLGDLKHVDRGNSLASYAIGMSDATAEGNNSGGTAFVRKNLDSLNTGGMSNYGVALVDRIRASDNPSFNRVRAEIETELHSVWHDEIYGEITAIFDTGDDAEASARSSARVAGVGDLLVVRKDLSRYEVGDISHIENMLPGESFSRTHQRVDESESFESVEVETSEETERELQSTSRSELSQEATEAVQEQLQLNAGVTATYRGPMVEVSANASVSYQRASQESTTTASKYAKDIVDRSVTRFSERTKTTRSRRETLRVTKDVTRSMENSGANDVVGVYRWVDKVDTCQVVNYGRRLLVDTIVPEPAAYTRDREKDHPQPRLGLERPEPPLLFGYKLQPEYISEITYQYYVAKYNVQNVEPPPAPRITHGVAIKQEGSSAESSLATVAPDSAMQVPVGYQLEEVTMDWAGSHTGNSDRFWEIIIANITFKSNPPSSGGVGGTTGGGLIAPGPDLGEIQGKVPITIVTKRYESFAVNAFATFDRTDSHYQEWQIRTYNAILNAYERQLAEYNDAVESARLDEEQLARELGNHPLTLQRFMQDEIRRLAIQSISGRDLGDFGFSRPEGPSTPPTIARDGIEDKSAYIRFVEQAFEWHAMSWVLYPYFWADGEGWEEHAFASNTNTEFAQFLRAGAARVVVPVTPGFDNDVLYFLEHGQPWQGGTPPVYEPEEGDASEAPYVPIIEELREQLGYDFETAPGELATTSGSDQVRPSVWSIEAASPGRELLVNGETYTIAELEADGFWRLDRPFAGATGTHPYALGPLLVGPSWEIRLPTTLVILASNEEKLRTGSE
ncbi:MAG: hypothetical protein QNJ14_12145 [Woeseiaceae bacterium]|nr:hypothetical protein [Woeseiaceae bacterium]